MMRSKPSPDPLSSMWAWIAHDLRFYRTKQGMTGDEFGKIMGVVRSTVSRMESGEYKIHDDHAKALDEHFDTGGHFQRLLFYARLGHDPAWFATRLDNERKASVIKVFEAQVIPGLLQIREYATALIEAGGLDVEQLVEERMARQEIFNREHPPELWVIITECTLHQLIGGREVAKAQLAHLLEMSRRPNVSIRIVPRSAGAHMGYDGSFVIMSLDDGDVAYASASGGGRLIATADEVREYSKRYDRIGQKALPEDLSRDLIRKVMEEL
jgi:transcriptional regulator with XRE-family HTH domain